MEETGILENPALLNLVLPDFEPGQKARATRHAKLGADHPDSLEAMNNLAVAYQRAGKLDLALPLRSRR